MTEKACKKCGSTDLAPSGSCRPCKKISNAAYKASIKGGGPLKTKVPKPRLDKPQATPKLEIPAGFGFSAEVTDDGFLQIAQANSDGETADTLILTKVEARRLFQEFSGWCA